MIVIHRAVIARSMIRSAFISPACLQPRQTITAVNRVTRRFSAENQDIRKMVDPQRVVNFDDVMKGIEHPNKVIIDVRNPDEVNSTGKIPSSINIPLDNVESALNSMSETDFERQYQRRKPQPSNELIFYSRSGRRSTEALDKALRLGYSNSKTYIGSWEEWSSKTKKI